MNTVHGATVQTELQYTRHAALQCHTIESELARDTHGAGHKCLAEVAVQQAVEPLLLVTAKPRRLRAASLVAGTSTSTSTSTSTLRRCCSLPACVLPSWLHSRPTPIVLLPPHGVRGRAQVHLQRRHAPDAHAHLNRTEQAHGVGWGRSARASAAIHPPWDDNPT